MPFRIDEKSRKAIVKASEREIAGKKPRKKPGRKSIEEINERILREKYGKK